MIKTQQSSKTRAAYGGTTTVSEYTYNSDGIRVKQTVTTDGGTPQVTQYLIDPNNLTGLPQTLEEKDGSGTITSGNRHVKGAQCGG